MIRCVTGDEECGQCEPCEARATIRGVIALLTEAAQNLPFDNPAFEMRVAVVEANLKLKSLLEET